MSYYPKGRDLEKFKKLIASLSSGLSTPRRTSLSLQEQLKITLERFQNVQVPVQSVTM